MTTRAKRARRRLDITGRAGAAATLAAVVAAAPAWAQPAQRTPDPQRGREIAERLCSGCHRVTPDQPLSGGWVDVPSFPEIANRPGRTPERIVGSVMIPHPPMPDIALATGTLHDIAAYILSFKKPE